MCSPITACAHYYVMVFKFQWKPIWLATQLQLAPQNDWTGWQSRVSYDWCIRTGPNLPSNRVCECYINAHLHVLIYNDLSLSRITTWAFLKECKIASTAALQVQVHEAGGLQRRQAGAAFADLLSAMDPEDLSEAFLAGKSWVFITELHVPHLWVNSSRAMLSC